jgi:hypothetical protein
MRVDVNGPSSLDFFAHRLPASPRRDPSGNGNHPTAAPEFHVHFTFCFLDLLPEFMFEKKERMFYLVKEYTWVEIACQ